MQLRQTMIPHLRHSATRSSAHAHIFVLRAYRGEAVDVEFEGEEFELPQSLSEAGSGVWRRSESKGRESKAQRNEVARSWAVYWFRLALMLRQVMDNACKSLRSRWEAMERATLDERVSRHRGLATKVPVSAYG